MKIGFIGCVQSSYRALETLLTLSNEGIEVVAVVTKPESVVNSDFADLTPLCKENAIPVHYEIANQKEDSLAFLKRYKPDVIYCFGWSYLLKKDVLELAPYGSIGYHPAPLPLARGRHPIIWALALGLNETASTFFLMDEGADSGPIVSQKKVLITPEDNATSLYNKLLDTFSHQILEFTKLLAKGAAKFQPQDHSKATYWRKRSRKDGLIDWRMQAVDVHNLVRALAPPYPGAEFNYNKNTINVVNTSLCTESFSRLIEPGRILKIDSDKFLVKCGGATALWVHDAQFVSNLSTGDYL